VLKQPDGRLLVAGSFASVQGIPRSRLARLRPNGALDMGFNVSAIASGTVYTLALQPDGRILAGGYFILTNGAANIARFNADGSPDPSFQPGLGPDGTVYGLALQPSGKIILGGDFASVDGITCGFYARLLAEGAVDAGFDSSVGADSTVFAVAALPDGGVLIAGDFMTVNNISRPGIARVNGEDHEFRFTGAQPRGAQLGLTLNVLPGLTYLLEASTNLVNWTVIDTNQAVTGSLEFMEPLDPQAGQRFFRARQEP
jgi:uncharacterized delta-60 repeat protein